MFNERVILEYKQKVSKQGNSGYHVKISYVQKDMKTGHKKPEVFIFNELYTEDKFNEWLYKKLQNKVIKKMILEIMKYINEGEKEHEEILTITTGEDLEFEIENLY